MKTVLCISCNKEIIVPDGDNSFYSCEECHNNTSFTERVYSDDICKNKHHHNPQSNAANQKVNKLYDRQRVLDIIKDSDGITSKEIARRLNKQLHQVSGRLSELKADEIISETGLKREGCAVYTVTPKQMRLF